MHLAPLSSVVLHDNRAHPHCHLLVANSNPFAGDDRLHWNPSTLKEMQGLEWVAPATAEKFFLSLPRLLRRCSETVPREDDHENKLVSSCSLVKLTDSWAALRSCWKLPICPRSNSTDTTVPSRSALPGSCLNIGNNLSNGKLNDLKDFIVRISRSGNNPGNSSRDCVVKADISKFYFLDGNKTGPLIMTIKLLLQRLIQ